MTNNTSPARWNDRPYWFKADLTTLVCKPLTLQHRSGEWKSHQSLSWWKPWSCFCWEVDWSTLTTCHWLLSCWLLFWSTSAPHMVLPWPLTPDPWLLSSEACDDDAAHFSSIITCFFSFKTHETYDKTVLAFWALQALFAVLLHLLFLNFWNVF